MKPITLGCVALLVASVAACAPEGAPGAKSVVINEVSTFHGDYLELFNPSDADRDIGGFEVRTKANPGDALILTGNTVLAPGGFLLIESVSLELSDTVSLLDTAAVVVDEIAWLADEGSPSRGRFPDGADDVQTFLAPTPGTANTTGLPEDNPSPVRIVINEVTSSLTDDIELLSLEEEDLDITGFWFIDSSNNPSNERVVFDGFIFASGAYVVSQNNDQRFGLASEGDRVALFDSENRLVDVVEWAENDALVSFCRIPDGEGEPRPCSAPTFGAANVP